MKKTRLQCNDFWGYASCAPAKSGAGISLLQLHMATTDAPASFLSSAFMRTKIMVSWMGAPKGAPVSMCAGKANSVQFTTHKISLFGGEFNFTHMEAANMATTPTLDLSFAVSAPDLQIVGGRVLTSSLAIAAYFHRDHKNVLRTIEAMECTASFTELNFELSEYEDSTGRKLPCYHITRDGFAFLAMGFTGKKAAQFKEAYITAFNQMEERLRAPALTGPRTRLLMAMDGDKVSSVQAVPFDSFIADCDSFADMFPNLSHRMTPADLVRISQECMSRLAYLAGSEINHGKH